LVVKSKGSAHVQPVVVLPTIKKFFRKRNDADIGTKARRVYQWRWKRTPPTSIAKVKFEKEM